MPLRQKLALAILAALSFQGAAFAAAEKPPSRWTVVTVDLTKPPAEPKAAKRPARRNVARNEVSRKDVAAKPNTKKHAVGRTAVAKAPVTRTPVAKAPVRHLDDDVVPVARADFASVRPSWMTRTLADWVVSTRDNGSAAFFVIDKRNARLFVFDPRGRLQGDAPVLLGLAHGDDSVPGIGEKPLAAIKPQERTTPAGRFVAERGFNAQGEDIVWVDYADAISLHRVRPLQKSERRLERLDSPTAADNRISYGCINVPVAFYNHVVQRAWANGGVVVYVLPETRPFTQVFPRERSFLNTAGLIRRVG